MVFLLRLRCPRPTRLQALMPRRAAIWQRIARALQGQPRIPFVGIGLFGPVKTLVTVARL